MKRGADSHRRTFLSWLHFAVVLGGLAVGLLNFGDKVGKISAAMYTVIGELATHPGNSSRFGC
jgi:hypothetical protein